MFFDFRNRFASTKNDLKNEVFRKRFFFQREIIKIILIYSKKQNFFIGIFHLKKD